MLPEVDSVRSIEESRAEQDARAAALTATVDEAVRTLVSPGFEPEDHVESPVVKYKRDIGKWCCLLCQRQFATETVLAHHLNGGAHLRKLAQAESSGRIKGAVATGDDDRKGGSGHQRRRRRRRRRRRLVAAAQPTARGRGRAP